MYSKWLDEDNEEIDVSTEELERLKKQFKDVTDKLKSHTSAQMDTHEALNDKEKRLRVRALCAPRFFCGGAVVVGTNPSVNHRL